MAEKTEARSPGTRSQKRAPDKRAPKAAAKRAVPPAPSGEAPEEAKKASKKPDVAQQITAEERWHMIAEAAYYIAEKRGFGPGHPADDWAAAEAQIDSQLAGTKQ
jgi:hypothetical protein